MEAKIIGWIDLDKAIDKAKKNPHQYVPEIEYFEEEDSYEMPPVHGDEWMMEDEMLDRMMRDQNQFEY